jgi:Baseplate J-like protein
VTTPYQPPPDVSGYTDLRVFDRTDQEIFDLTVAALQQLMPDWTPREANVEVLLIEAMALEMSEGIAAINRLPGALLETLLRFLRVTKDYGAAPIATAAVTCADLLGHTIPGGTRFYVPTADGTGAVVMLVEAPGITIPVGSSTGVVSLIGDVYTDAANGVPAGTLVTPLSPLAFLESATLATPVADGRSPETDAVWRDRGVNRLSRLSEALVLPRHFQAAALEHPGVARAVVVDNTDPGTSGVGDDPGHVTVAVLGDGGALLSTGAKTEVQADLQEDSHSALTVHVTDVAISTVTLSVAVHLSDSTDPTAVTTAVRQAIIAYLNPLTWDGGTTVRRNELIALVDRVSGVDYVSSVTITGANGAGDLVLATASTVPTATVGSLTVSVV